MKHLIAILSLYTLLFAGRANATTYYVSPSGSDSNPGTIDKPFASWQKLSSVLRAGDLAYIRGGTYRSPKAMGHGNYPVDFRNLNGTASAHITISAYPGESPVLNLDNIVESVFMIGFYLGNCSYIDFKGLRITGLKQSTNPVQSLDGWRVDLCNQITFTQCEVDHMQGPGWRITQATPTSSVITYTNCDSHDNGDPLNTGGGVYGNADGFDANGGTVTYIGCRAWWNSDDGFDAFYSDAPVTYKNCWSFWNGFIPGTFTDPGGQADGDGFKWGNTTSDLRTTHLRTFTNCLAFQNKGWGFDQNVARCIAWFYNNTSYQNGFKNTSHGNGTGGGWAAGYNINPPVAIVLKNNISYNDATAVSNFSGLIQDHNTWNNLAASTASFASMDTTAVTGPRGADGSLPVLAFLHLAPGSNLIDKGVDVTLPFSGSVPDLGAFEYSTSSPTNQLPIADAGQPQVIVLPTSSVTLNGNASRDPDGTVNSYNWSKISGPSPGIISTPTLVTTTVTSLVQGTYQFELAVTDDKGAIEKDTVTIAVNNANQPPIADAGQSQVIVLPTSSVTLNGNASRDPDGTINSYNWSKLEGPSSAAISTPTLMTTNVTALVQGTYQFELTVTDDKGATGKDTITITVSNANQSPAADAGQSQVIVLPTSSVTLDGSASGDPDGTINSYNWSKITGPSSADISTPDLVATNVTTLVPGTYKFQLMVTDDQGAVGMDTVTITVKNANQSPVADGGQSQAIVLPTSSVTLDGSASGDPDGTINSYNWSEIEGPSSAVISTPELVTTNVTTLVQGTYKFQLLVTDDQGAVGMDIVTVTVTSANRSPIAEAGQTQVIVLPTNSAILDGSATSDPDGTVNSYSWSEISGPSSATISTPDLVTTNVTALVQGTYKFKLIVTDDQGATGTDIVIITVSNPNTGTNQSPVADAGQSQEIVLPTSSVTLDGSASGDPDGTVSSYDWSEIEGPSSALISTPDLVTTDVATLVQGIYKFQLIVTDDQGATEMDTVTITVNKGNQSPVADAGQSQVIVLPTSSVTLDGSASDDPDGTINSYSWSEIAGPSSALISTPDLETTNVTTLVQGTYKFELVVTDDKGAIGKDTVTIIVNKANQLPVADAGQSQVIVLPTSSVTLDGSASNDPDGTLNSYNWSKLSGPSSGTISTPTSVSTNVTALVQGTYQFQLIVTDDKGATGKDTVTITVNNANQSPVADAGQSQVIILPTSSVTLNASSSNDPDGTINSYNWSKLSGPSSGTISTPTSVSTNVTALVQGTYQFQLIVTDDKGATGKDTVTITVNNANQSPVADAGQSQVIILPTSSVTLNASSSNDPDGTINSYNWSKISGPSSGTISTPTSVSTSVTSLVQGTYQFQLVVTDNKGATGKDTVTITVNANQSPVADAGQSQVIILPTSSVTLNGSASRDPDGTINSFNWSKISGPSSGTISTPTQVTTNVTSLVQGTYQFQLFVTDNKGATGKDTVTITVNSAPTAYYFSSSTGNDSRTSAQAQNSLTPWKTLDKLNSIFSTLKPGDVIYFKRGDTFYGSINPTTSGTSSAAIKFAAYSTGNKPIITGLSDATGWTTVGTNIWESSTIPTGQASAMIVAINGTSYPMGRWPNATDTWGGFRKISSHSGSTSITDVSLTGTPNWRGATLVMRKNQYRMEKGTVTTHSGTTLTYSSTWNQTAVTDNYGYFIENSLSTLDKQNEWYYNSSTKKLDIYSTSTPSNVKISTITTLINASSRSYLSFDNLNIQGSIGRMILVSSSSHISFTNCDLSNAGSDAIYGTNCSYLDVENCTITNSNHTAITLDQGASNTIVKNNTITSSAANPGMLDNYWLYAGVYVVGSNTTVEKNLVRKSGYLGIAFAKGNSVSIKNNFVDSSFLILDEGGAIYTVRGSDATVYTSRVIDGNIVTNMLAALNGKPGTQGAGAGIQMDDNSQGVTITNNSIANGAMYGILLSNAHEITITNNTVYNCTSGAMAMVHDAGLNLIRNVNQTRNKFVMRTANTNSGTWSYQTSANDVLQFGSSDSNIIATPINDVNAFFTFDGSTNRHQTVAQWQSFSGKDVHSKKSPKTITTVNDLRFEYNATSSSKTVSLGKAYIDIAGTSYPSSTTLAPYTSAVLIAGSLTAQSVATAEVIDETTLNEKPLLTIYPNPVTNNFILQLSNNHMGKMDVQVVNQAGAIVRSYIFNKDQVVNQITVPAHDLPSGVYFIHVQIGSWSDKRKIVKL